MCGAHRSELLELFLGAGSLGHLEHIEAHGLAEGPAFTHCDDVADLHVPETGGQVHGHILVAFLKAIVLPDVVQVVTADDNGPLHLHLCHHTRQNSSSDRDITRERAFLVNVGALNGLLWCLEAQTDVLIISWQFLLAGFSKQDPLLVLEDGRLLLVGTLSLQR